jgi:hypothetical protein
MREDLELEHWGPQTVVAAFLQGITSLVFPCRLYNPASQLTATPLPPRGEKKGQSKLAAWRSGGGASSVITYRYTHPLPGGGRLNPDDKLFEYVLKNGYLKRVP